MPEHAAPDQADQHERVLKAEQRSLVISLTAAGVLSVVGIAWGLSVSSQIILFDGAYGVIGVALSALTLHASNLVKRGPSSRYPFGREALGPLVLGVQGLVLLGAFGFAVIDAIRRAVKVAPEPAGLVEFIHDMPTRPTPASVSTGVASC